MKSEKMPSYRLTARTILLNKLTAALPMLLFMILYFILFNDLETRQVSGYFYPSTWLDEQIPFLPCFVIPYFAWFLWIPMVVIYLLLTDEEEYRHTSQQLIIGMSVFLVISYLFPSKLSLRPAILPDQGWFCQIIALLYQTDTPTNVFPSIHVFNTCVALRAVFHGQGKLFKNQYVQVFSVILSVLICLSTLFIKQHAITDVLGAFLMYGLILQAVNFRIQHPAHRLRPLYAPLLHSAGSTGEYRRKQ